MSNTGLGAKPIERGEKNKGITLDGRTAFNAEKFTEFDHKSKLTFSAWLKIDAPVSGAVFAKMDVLEKHRGYDLWLDNGKPGIHLIHDWPANAIKVVADTALVPGKWQHVAVSYDGSGEAKGVAIYIDGKPVKSSLVGGKKLTGTIKNEVRFRIGSRSTNAFFKGAVDDIRIYERVLKPEQIPVLNRDLIGEAHGTEPAKRTPEQKKLSYNHYLSSLGTNYRRDVGKRILITFEKEKILSGKTTSMVMQDNPPKKMRPTYILNRGAYDQPMKDEKISPDTPDILPALPDDAKPNRLSLAKWLFSSDHPLTARVTVNQLWQVFFGKGIVATPADFGSQGAFPSHPDLLDWLAIEFRDSGWDVKKMVKLIVTSGTYRQASKVRSGDLEGDPENNFLARAPRFRLQAEFIRDNSLALGGILNRHMGGSGVKPYQPPGLWVEVGLSGKPAFVQDKGEKLYRRSIYTYWKRSSPPPTMQIFDAPTRETCVMKRPRTNTPLQALAAMNDVQMLETARHFAERMVREGGDTVESRTSFAFQLATARPPSEAELKALVEVYQHGEKSFSNEEGKNAKLLIDFAGESKRDETIPAAEHAALTMVANLILNLDETLTRE